jgi:hypothetical protein
MTKVILTQLEAILAVDQARPGRTHCRFARLRGETAKAIVDKGPEQRTASKQ